MKAKSCIKKKFFIMLCMFVLSVPGAHAAIITFDGLPGTAMAGYSYIGANNTYTRFTNATSAVNGFDFYSIDHLYIGTAYQTYYGYSDDSTVPYNGTDYLLTYSPITISASSGDLFSFNSIDLATWHDVPGSPYYRADQQYIITGYYYGGGSISQTVTLDSIYNQNDTDGNDFNHFTFSGFTNLSSLTIGISGSYYPYFTLDNLEVNAAPIPEPATMLLLGSGLVGLAGFRRKNKK